MCGLTALFSPSGEARLADAVAMTDVVRHRGPDSEGFCVVSDTDVQRLSGPDTISFAGAADLPSAPSSSSAGQQLQGLVVLGHRRLSIQDPTVAGHQPFTDADRDLWLTFNGEIYNFVELRSQLRSLGHRFVGHSDTEVALAAYKEWGADCLKRFVGMFALVIVDRRRRVLFAARDHFGVKPLYYWRSPSGTIAFASEIKQFSVLDGWSARMNGHRVYDFLNFGMHDHTAETMFSDVHQLGAGEYVELNLATGATDVTPRKWWSLEPSPFHGSFEEAAKEFRIRFEESVSLHLRSDVPVGSCLSGGLDSSSIVCTSNAALRASGDDFTQLAFSATSDDSTVDESRWIELVRAATGVDVHARTPQMSDVPDLLPSLTWHMDEPFGSTSIFAQWTVFQLAAENQVKVMLDGQGADEQLAGYTPFFAWRFQELLRRGRMRELAHDISATRRMHSGTTRMLAQLTAYLMVPPSIARWGGRLVKAPGQQPDAWIDRAALGVTGYPDPLRETGAKEPTVRGLATAQLTRSNLPMLLHYEDRDSMAHSIEARVPFLDHRLVEFVLGLPSAYLIGEGTTKRVLRAGMMGSSLPEPIRNRVDKIGFQTAEQRWMRSDDPQGVLRLVRAAVDSSAGVLTPGALARAEDVLAGRRPFDFGVWRMISLGSWIDKFGVRP